jgi:tripartite ATP-independent transporter DctM subunit
MFESLVGFAVLFVLVLVRVPIAFAMILVGTAGFAIMRSWETSLKLLGNVVFDTGLSFTLAVIPLFILMGNLLTISGVSQSLYSGAHRMLGRTRGGLAMASIVACGGFSAVSGSSLATAATMSKVAMPSMRKAGYADSLATGSISAGGTLGILIPPSVVLIIYGLITEADIGLLFIAGILPGLVGVLFYLLAVYITVLIKPDLAPPNTETEPMSTRDFYGVMSVVGLFVVIMGGIYGGLFTPSEAAGIGAGTALVIAVAMGGLTFTKLKNACIDSARTTAMIFAIIIGAEVFSNFVNFAGLPYALADWIIGIGATPYMVILGIVIVYIILGAVLESLSMILLTVPVFYPLVTELDFGTGILSDPDAILIWFGILVVVVTEISLISPPIGLNIFVLKSVIPDVPLKTMFIGIIPFLIADIARLMLLVFVPAISLYLVFP